MKGKAGVQRTQSFAGGLGCLSSIGFLKAGSRGAAPGGVSGVSPDFLPPFAPEGGVPKNLYLKAPDSPGPQANYYPEPGERVLGEPCNGASRSRTSGRTAGRR